uniref:Peptidase M12B domain-containing protein n=1 Tax=Plectus sambesii TaxID=2011161 RepID=A0A914W7Y9_9BILA
MCQLPTSLLFLLSIAATATLATSSHSEFVKDSDVLFRNRVKRAAVREDGAVNLGDSIPGDSIPDWSDAELDGKVRYLQALIVVDAQVASYYDNSLDKIKDGVTNLLLNANFYLYQLDLRITVVDVSVWSQVNATLEEFLAYRNGLIDQLPEHDFAFLMSYRYGGGVAYVNGICGNAAAGICGFFPENPAEYAGVFFHELAHLLGMPHEGVAPCKCKHQPPGTCLKIDGFNYDCSVQALVNKLPDSQCIQTLPESLAVTTVPMCGNGIKEEGEQCDCGPEKYCNKWNCMAATCKQKISDFQQYLIIFFAVLAGIGTGSMMIYLNYIRPHKTPQSKRPRIGRNLSSVKIETPSLAKDAKLQPTRVAPAVAPIRAAPAPPKPAPARPSNAAVQNLMGTLNSATIQKVRPEISAPMATIVASKKVIHETPTGQQAPSVVPAIPPKPALPSVHTKPTLPTKIVREIVEAKETALIGNQSDTTSNEPKTPKIGHQNDCALPWKSKPNVPVPVVPKPPSAALKPKLPEKAPVGLAVPHPPSPAAKPKPMIAVKPQRPSEEEERIYDVPPVIDEDSRGAAVNNLVKLFESSKAAST